MANLDPLIVFKFEATKNHQLFQLGEALHGFLGGQMHQVPAMYKIPTLANLPSHKILANHHRRLAHHTTAAGLAEELHGLAEALALHKLVLMIGFSLGFVEDLWFGIYGFWFDDWVLFCFVFDVG